MESCARQSPPPQLHRRCWPSEAFGARPTTVPVEGFSTSKWSAACTALPLMTREKRCIGLLLKSVLCLIEDRMRRQKQLPVFQLVAEHRIRDVVNPIDVSSLAFEVHRRFDDIRRKARCADSRVQSPTWLAASKTIGGAAASKLTPIGSRPAATSSTCFCNSRRSSTIPLSLEASLSSECSVIGPCPICASQSPGNSR